MGHAQARTAGVAGAGVAGASGAGISYADAAAISASISHVSASTSAHVSSYFSCETATTMQATEGVCAIARIDQYTTGLPHMDAYCLPLGLPNRLPTPPAAMIAQVSGCVDCGAVASTCGISTCVMPAYPTFCTGCLPISMDCQHPGYPGVMGFAQYHQVVAEVNQIRPRFYRPYPCAPPKR